MTEESADLRESDPILFEQDFEKNGKLMTTQHEKPVFRPFQAEQSNYQQIIHQSVHSTINHILSADVWKVVTLYTGTEFAVEFTEPLLIASIGGAMKYMTIVHRDTWWSYFGQALDMLAIGGEEVSVIREHNGACLFVHVYKKLKRFGNMIIARKLRNLSVLGGLRLVPYIPVSSLLGTDVCLHDTATWDLKTSNFANLMFIFSFVIETDNTPNKKQPAQQLLMDVGINDTYYSAVFVHGKPEDLGDRYVFAPGQITDSQKEQSVKDHRKSKTKVIYGKFYSKDTPLSMSRFMRMKKWTKVTVRLFFRFDKKPDPYIIDKHRETTRQKEMLNEDDPSRVNAPLCQAERPCGTSHLSKRKLCNGPKIPFNGVMSRIETVARMMSGLNENMVIAQSFMERWLHRVLAEARSGMMDANTVMIKWAGHWMVHKSSTILMRAYIEPGVVTDLYEATDYKFKPDINQLILLKQNFRFFQHAHCRQQMELKRSLGYENWELYMDGSTVKLRKKKVSRKRGTKRSFDQITLSINDGSVKSINSASKSERKGKGKDTTTDKKKTKESTTKNDSSPKEDKLPSPSPSSPSKKRKLS